MGFKFKVTIWVIGLCLIFPNYIFAHSGGTDENGCHNDNINGGFHCHNPKGSSSGGSDSNDGVLIVVVVLVVGVAYWYYTSRDYITSDRALVKKSEKVENRFKLSLEPTSKTELDGATLQLSYTF